MAARTARALELSSPAIYGRFQDCAPATSQEQARRSTALKLSGPRTRVSLDAPHALRWQRRRERGAPRRRARARCRQVTRHLVAGTCFVRPHKALKAGAKLANCATSSTVSLLPDHVQARRTAGALNVNAGTSGSGWQRGRSMRGLLIATGAAESPASCARHRCESCCSSRCQRQ